MSTATYIIAWAGLILSFGLALAMIMALCAMAGRTERDIERWEDR